MHTPRDFWIHHVVFFSFSKRKGTTTTKGAVGKVVLYYGVGPLLLRPSNTHYYLWNLNYFGQGNHLYAGENV